MQIYSTDLRCKKRAARKQLRSSFRSTQTAKSLRPGTDVLKLCAALTEFGLPDIKADARLYAKAALFAVDALVKQANLHAALKLLDPLTEMCEEFDLPTLRRQALLRLCIVLRRMELLHDASFCADEGIELALSRCTKRLLKLFLEERAAIDSLVARARASKMNEEVYPIAEEYPSSRLLQEEGTSEFRPRIEALLFRSGKKSPRDPRRVGGKRKAVFVTTLLKKGFGPWLRKK